MPSSVDDPTPQVLPVRALLVTLVACVGLSYLLVPSDSEMVERLMLDQQYEHLATILNSEIGAGSNINGKLLHSLTSAQISALSHLLTLSPREQLENIFESNRPQTYNPIIHGLVMAAIRYVNVIPPAQAWAMISPHSDRMNGKQFLEISTLLGNSALAIEQPKLAASIFDRASTLPESTAQTASSMVQAYRWSSQAETGALRLHQWLKGRSAGLGAEDRAQLTALNSTIALEAGKAGLAFDIAIENLEALPQGQSPTEEQMDLAVNGSLQSGRTRELLPWLKRFVAGIPQSSFPLKELRQQAAHPSDTLTHYRKWAAKLANFADWNSEFQVSFDQHWRLAAIGDLESLDRCVVLWDFLGCGQEMADLLVELGPQPQRPKLKLVQADLLASLGQDKEARPLYEQWLAAHPDDREAHYDLACLLEDMGDEDASLASFKLLVQRHPKDVPAIKKLAENFIRAEHFQEALDLYGRLRDEDQDHYTLENYAMLAESLDKYEDLFKAQWLTAKAEDPPATEPYLDMAETAGYLANGEEAVKRIEEGLVRLPQSAAIRVALADLYLRDDEYGKAWAVLKHDCVKRSYDGISRILDLVPELPNHNEVLTFIGNDVEKRFKLPPSARLDLAALYAMTGNNSKAEAVFASVPATPANCRLIAQAYFTSGVYEQAASFMERHIASKHNVKSDDHVFLGDVYELLGREEDARKAYAASIDLLAPDRRETALQTTPQLLLPNNRKATP